MDGVLLVAPNASSLRERRGEFSRSMRDVLRIKQDERATRHRIALSLEQVKVRINFLSLTTYNEWVLTRDDPISINRLSR